MSPVEKGWAVRFMLDQPGSRQMVWINTGGGYSPSRRCRQVFASRWEADDAARPWRMHKPRIVRVIFKAPPQSSGAIKGGG